jgi:hypothetical protein
MAIIDENETELESDDHRPPEYMTRSHSKNAPPASERMKYDLLIDDAAARTLIWSPDMLVAVSDKY